VVSTRAIEHFAARLKTGMAIILPQARHEILNETDEVRARFWAAFDAFVPGELEITTPHAQERTPRSGVEQLERGGMDAPVA
jgi:lysophospholipase